MFVPKYSITDVLLANIKRITILTQELNSRHFPKLILMKFEKTAREVSVYASTSIEGNPLPLTDVRKILKTRSEHIRDSEREVLNYNLALESLDSILQKSSTDVSLDLILEVHRKITDGLLLDFESGKLRKNPVVVNDPRTGNIVYLPPDIKEVNNLLEDLVSFTNENSQLIDPLILAGIFHKQMVIIHPFMDGNGRTTRLMTKVLLAKMGLNTFNLFSFENYYNQNITKYFKIVGEYGDYNELVRSIDFTKWLEYFTDGIIDELLRVDKMLPQNGYSPETKLEKHHLVILDYIKNNGFITDREYAHLVDRAKATRVLDFKKLILLELIERKGAGRATHYVLRESV